jgi:hypothetical protein
MALQAAQVGVVAAHNTKAVVAVVLTQLAATPFKMIQAQQEAVEQVGLTQSQAQVLLTLAAAAVLVVVSLRVQVVLAAAVAVEHLGFLE